MPATSILSLTAKGMPQSGFASGSKAPSASACGEQCLLVGEMDEDARIVRRLDALEDRLDRPRPGDRPSA